jgi:hypothetical protein
MTSRHPCRCRKTVGRSTRHGKPGFAVRLLSTFIQALMSGRADALCGSGYGERSTLRSNRRNGYRHRDLRETSEVGPRNLVHHVGQVGQRGCGGSGSCSGRAVLGAGSPAPQQARTRPVPGLGIVHDPSLRQVAGARFGECAPSR